MADITSVVITFFDHRSARSKHEECISLAELGVRIAITSASRKDNLPWLKLARFGNDLSAKGSLRHDRNVIAITGVEVDYDDEHMAFEAAIELLEKAGVLGIVYTSPSHRPDRPRWRVLCPTSTEMPPSKRAQLVARLNGLFGGVLAAESWTISQAYYFGAVADNPAHAVKVVEGGLIDLLDELDQIAIPKPGTKKNTRFNGADGSPVPAPGPIDEATLLDEIRTGASFHTSAIRLIGAWARAGIALVEAEKRIRTAFDAVLPADRDQRWRDRVREIPRLIEYVFDRRAEERDANEKDFARWEEQHPPYDGPDIVEEEDDADPSWGNHRREQPWPKLDPAAYHGLAGDIVRTIEPHTEADPVGILLQLLGLVGNAAGSAAYYRVEADLHHANLFELLVGETAKGRKGVSYGRARQPLEAADRDWAHGQISSGLSSGEGVIWAVRDPIMAPIKIGKGASPRTVMKTVDLGVEDKRLTIFESEFARTLQVLKRDTNTLSAVLRSAWDGRDLQILTKNSPARATGPHITVIAHVTAHELRSEIDRNSYTNGFLNRFLLCCVKRSKELPFGGAIDPEDMLELVQRLRPVLGSAKVQGRIDFSAAAADLWKAEYHELSAEHPGLFGAVVARAEAQTVRLALIYALLDQSPSIDVPHLHAALAVSKYAMDSARFVFGDALGDPVADELLRALRDAGADGMTRGQIYDYFDRHQSRRRIFTALTMLARHGLARTSRKRSRGRPAEVWVAT